MKTLGKKLNSLTLKAHFKAIALKDRAMHALKNEDGDTNFLSIIIILAIVLVLAITFIALKDKIVDLVEKAWKKFTEQFSGQDKGSFGEANV